MGEGRTSKSISAAQIKGFENKNRAQLAGLESWNGSGRSGESGQI